MNGQDSCFKNAFQQKEADRTASRVQKSFRKKALSFTRLLAVTVLFFVLGALLGVQLFSRVEIVLPESLRVRFYTPFFGCESVSEYVLRLLSGLFPAVLSMGELLLSLTAKNRQRALLLSLAILQALRGLRCAYIATAFDTSFAVFYDRLTVLLASAVLCIYAYRLTICVSLGFPKKSPAPGTIRRFFSYTARFLLWELIPLLLRSIVLTVFAS